MTNVIKGPWRESKTTEDAEFINALESTLQRRLIVLHGSISETPIEELEKLEKVMTLLDEIFRTGV